MDFPFARWYFPVFLAGATLSAQGTAIADSLFRTGEYSAAINAYAEIGTPAAALQIARAYEANAQYDKALVQYEAVVRADRGRTVARFEFGKLLLRLGRHGAASDTLDNLIRDYIEE